MHDGSHKLHGLVTAGAEGSYRFVVHTIRLVNFANGDFDLG